MKAERRNGRVHLTDRDRDILGALAIARYLSTQQIARLFFPGRAQPVYCERLNRLARLRRADPSVPGDVDFGAFIAKRVIGIDGYPIHVWGLTREGYRRAAPFLEGVPGARIPRHETPEPFLAHTLMLNELFVGLLETGTREPARLEQGEKARFRWIGTEQLNIEFQMTRCDRRSEEERFRSRRLQPDAVLEVPRIRKRFFLECETGTQSIRSADPYNRGSIQSKAVRYQSFLSGDLSVATDQTYYQRAFPDGYTAEVIFLVPDEGRRDRVQAFLTSWRKEAGAEDFPISVATIEMAIASFRHLIGGADQTLVLYPTRSIRADELSVLASFHTDSIRTIKRVREEIRTWNIQQGSRMPMPEYPRDTDRVRFILHRLFWPVAEGTPAPGSSPARPPHPR